MSPIDLYPLILITVPIADDTTVRIKVNFVILFIFTYFILLTTILCKDKSIFCNQEHLVIFIFEINIFEINIFDNY